MKSTRTSQILILLLILTAVARSQSAPALTTNLCGSAPIEQGEALNYFREGTRLIRDRKFEEAAGAFEQAIKLKQVPKQWQKK